MTFFIYNNSENAEYDAGVKYSLLSIYVVHVLFCVVHIRRLHTVWHILLIVTGVLLLGYHLWKCRFEQGR
jgi:hypothetical protein